KRPTSRARRGCQWMCERSEPSWRPPCPSLEHGVHLVSGPAQASVLYACPVEDRWLTRHLSEAGCRAGAVLVSQNMSRNPLDRDASGRRIAVVASELTALTFGTPDPQRLARFWGGLLGQVVTTERA